MTEDEIQLLGAMLDAKLSRVEGRADEKLSGLEGRFDTMDQRLTTVDRRVDDLHRHFDVVAEDLEGQVRGRSTMAPWTDEAARGEQ